MSKNQIIKFEIGVYIIIFIQILIIKEYFYNKS